MNIATMDLDVTYECIMYVFAVYGHVTMFG